MQWFVQLDLAKRNTKYQMINFKAQGYKCKMTTNEKNWKQARRAYSNLKS